MNSSPIKFDVVLYVRGVDLDPHCISTLLGVEASRCQVKGQRSWTTHGTEVVAKMGLWALSAEGNDADVVALIANLVGRVGGSNVPKLAGVPEVEDVYVDVFATMDAEDEGGGTFEFELGAAEIAALSRLSVPVKFSLAVVRK